MKNPHKKLYTLKNQGILSIMILKMKLFNSKIVCASVRNKKDNWWTKVIVIPIKNIRPSIWYKSRGNVFFVQKTFVLLSLSMRRSQLIPTTKLILPPKYYFRFISLIGYTLFLIPSSHSFIISFSNSLA